MEMVEPFDVDNNELEGMTPQQVFTLGVEWGLFYPMVSTGGQLTVHEANRGRLVALALRHGKEPSVQPFGEGFVSLMIEKPQDCVEQS